MNTLNPTSRTLVLLDVENLLETSHFSIADVVQLRQRMLRTMTLPEDAQFVVATSAAQTLVTASLGWPGARAVWTPGRNGADKALRSILAEEDVAHRFGTVVIGSGDGGFTMPARELVDRGVRVDVVHARGTLARTLHSSVTSSHRLPSQRRSKGAGRKRGCAPAVAPAMGGAA